LTDFHSSTDFCSGFAATVGCVVDSIERFDPDLLGFDLSLGRGGDDVVRGTNVAGFSSYALYHS